MQVLGVLLVVQWLEWILMLIRNHDTWNTPQNWTNQWLQVGTISVVCMRGMATYLVPKKPLKQRLNSMLDMSRGRRKID